MLKSFNRCGDVSCTFASTQRKRIEYSNNIDSKRLLLSSECSSRLPACIGRELLPSTEIVHLGRRDASCHTSIDQEGNIARQRPQLVFNRDLDSHLSLEDCKVAAS